MRPVGKSMFDSDPVKVFIAPPGQGSAEQWVRLQYPDIVRDKVRRAPGERVGVVTVLDGDRFGVSTRKKSLDRALSDKGESPRSAEERIAICVPTWSIETWLAWLCGWKDVAENQSYKNETRYRRAVDQGQISPATALDHWPNPDSAEGATVPSLTDARRELDRLTRQ